MQFFSTRDQNRKVTSSEAIAQGLSNEGGLFVPESFPQVDVKALCELDYPAMAAAVIKEYLTDYSQDFLTEAARKTYGDAFGGKAGYLAPVEIPMRWSLAWPYLCIQGLRSAADAEASGGSQKESGTHGKDPDPCGDQR